MEKKGNFFAKIGAGISKACKAVVSFFKKIEWNKTVNPIVAYSVFGGVCILSFVLFLVICL